LSNYFLKLTLILLGSFSLISCGYIVLFSDSSALDYSKIESELTGKSTSPNFNYFFTPGDKIDTFYMESLFSVLTKKYNIEMNRKINYYKYKGIDQIERLTNRRMNAFAESNSTNFHSIWPKDNHEITHILLGHLSPKLFNEGIAVANQIDTKKLNWEKIYFNRSDIDSVSLVQIKQNNLPLLDSLLQVSSFNAYDPEISYSISGSFVKYLLKQEKIDLIKKFYSEAMFNDTNEIIRKKFYAIFRKNLDDYWNEWKINLK